MQRNASSSHMVTKFQSFEANLDVYIFLIALIVEEISVHKTSQYRINKNVLTGCTENVKNIIHICSYLSNAVFSYIQCISKLMFHLQRITTPFLDTDIT